MPKAKLRGIGEHLSHPQPCVDVGPFSDQEAKLQALDGSSTLAVDTLVETFGRILLVITQAEVVIDNTELLISVGLESV